VTNIVTCNQIDDQSLGAVLADAFLSCGLGTMRYEFTRFTAECDGQGQGFAELTHIRLGFNSPSEANQAHYALQFCFPKWRIWPGKARTRKEATLFNLGYNITEQSYLIYFSFSVTLSFTLSVTNLLA
jgi:hypothetical protein